MLNNASEEAAEMRRKMRDDMLALSATEPMASNTIGAVIVALLKRSDAISFSAMVKQLELAAAGEIGLTGISDLSAKGALEFISGLPEQPEDPEAPLGQQ